MLKLSDKLREERKKNSEKLLEKSKEKAAEKEEKSAGSKDGMMYLYDTDIKTIIEAVREDHAGKVNTKQQAGVGANLDIQA